MDVFEVADVTDDETYFTMGIYSTLDLALAELDKAEPPWVTPDPWRDYLECAEFEVRRRPMDAYSEFGKTVATVVWRMLDGEKWEREAKLLEASDIKVENISPNPDAALSHLEARVVELEAENAELRHKLLDELSYLTQLTELEAQLAEARELLTDLDGMEPIKASWVERRDAWLKGVSDE